MAIMVNVQPSEQTAVRFVHRPGELPFLVVVDGSAAVWFWPADDPSGPRVAAEFADQLLTSAHHWLQACRELASSARQRPYVGEGR